MCRPDQDRHGRRGQRRRAMRDDGAVRLGRWALAGGLSGAVLLGCTAGDPPPDAAPTAGGGSPVATRCGAGPLRLAGSPVQDAAVAAWIRGYREACPAAPVVVVRPVPAGTFAVLDGAVQLAAAELSPAADPDPTATGGCRPVGVPVLAAPVTVVHSLPGLPALTVTPSVLARVYLGQVTEWSDPEIAAANPGVELPSAPIAVVRPDAPGAATEALSRFLAARVPELWTVPPGSAWPAAPAGAPVADVLGQVRRTPGALGYVAGPVPRGRGAAAASVDVDSAGVAPTAAAVRSAVAAADVGGDSPDVRVTVDPGLDDTGAYPLALVGYQVTCLAAGDPRSGPVEAFLAYATGAAGQAQLERLGYAPLPDELLGRVRSAVGSLSDS
jgi:phosphate transport system substrate-binding protein